MITEDEGLEMFYKNLDFIDFMINRRRPLKYGNLTK